MLAVVYVWAFSGIPFSGIKETAGQVTKAIFSGLLSPDWDFVYLPGGGISARLARYAGYIHSGDDHIGGHLYPVRFLGRGQHDRFHTHLRIRQSLCSVWSASS